MGSWQRISPSIVWSGDRWVARVARVALTMSALLAGMSLVSAPGGQVAVSEVPAAAATAAAPPATTLNVVAHEDDDILFINPDVSRDITVGRRVVTVFATAGDAGGTTAYWRGRENGAMAGYAKMAGGGRWTVSRARIAGHPIVRATLSGKPITLLFLRLPDGRGYAKHNFETMRELWRGALGTIHAIDRSTSYTKESLTTTLSAVMDLYRPNVIRTLDYAGRYGDGDHSDHHSAAYFAHAAQRDYRALHTMTGYLGYPMEGFAVNLPVATRATKLGVFLAYAQHDSHVCRTRQACQANADYTARFARRYTSAHQLGGGRNIASNAQVSASSEDHAAGRSAARAVDGTVVGPGAGEWTTRAGRDGSWINLQWTEQQYVNRIVLYDRPAITDQVTAGILSFSDGSTLNVPALANEGAATIITFPPRSITSLRFDITAVSAATRNAGLAEIQAYAITPTT